MLMWTANFSNILDIAHTRARLTPSKIAIVDYSKGSRETYTYMELEQAASNVSVMFEEYKVGKGDVIAVLAYNSIEYLYIFLATPKKGFILAPLNWRLTYKELSFIIDDVKPKIVFIDEEFEGLLKEALSLANHKPNHIVFLNELKNIHKISLGKTYIKANIDVEDIQMLLYTGGTTGPPKAAMISFRQTLWNAINTVLSWGLRPDDVAPVFFPFFHTGGWHVITIPLYLIGGRLVLVKRFHPDEAIDIIEKEQCTVVIGVPTMFYLMARSPKFKLAKFESVRFFKSGGGMSSLTLMQEYWAKGKEYYQGYGLTEAGPNLFYTPPETMLTKPYSIGKPSLFAEFKIVKDDGSEARPGEVGELWVRGPITFSGYWGRPEETRNTIDPEGWVKTGDLFKMDEDGYYYFVERKKFMIKTGGENVYPSEIEEVIKGHHCVDEVAVFGVPDPKWGEAVAAIIKPKQGCELTSDDIKNYLRGRMAGYKIPKYVWIVDEVPKTSVGKIDYIGIKKRYSALVESQVSKP